MIDYNPFDDVDCIKSFVEQNYDSYLDWCVNRGIEDTESPENEKDYCSVKETRFLEFAWDYLEDLVMDDADRFNDYEGD